MFACGEVGLLGSQLLRGLVSRKKQCTCLNNVKKIKREGKAGVSESAVRELPQGRRKALHKQTHGGEQEKRASRNRWREKRLN